MRDEVNRLLTEALEQRESLFLIDLTISENNQIRVIIDGDKGVTVDDCIAISRAIEHNLDRDTLDFSLEVMSAGLTEPLQIPRQFVKNVGRKLKVKTEDGQIVEGKLMHADDEGLKLSWKAREPKPIGKGKVTVQKEAALEYNNIAEAKVMITFN